MKPENHSSSFIFVKNSTQERFTCLFICLCSQNLLRCAWSPDGSKIAAGSADRFVYVWDTTSRRILYKLPGHTGSINDVDFHPNEPICKSSFAVSLLHCGFKIRKRVAFNVILVSQVWGSATFMHIFFWFKVACHQ